MDYIEILAFDSLYGGLTWDDRIYLHLCQSGKVSTHDYSQRIKEIAECIYRNAWTSPKIRYLKDEVGLYCEDPETFSFIKIENYLKKYPKPN